MKTGLLKRTLSELTLRPLGTAADRVKELQARCMLTKGERGRHGGGVMTATDRVNALLACTFDPPSGESHAENVTRIRRLHLSLAFYNPLSPKLSPEDNARCAFQAVEGLGMRFDDLGHALDAIVDSMRKGAFERWAAGAIVTVSADFNGDGTVMLAFDRPQFNVSAIFKFAADDPDTGNMAIERIVRLNKTAFERLAIDEPT
jgi:hypothetical protein